MDARVDDACVLVCKGGCIDACDVVVLISNWMCVRGSVRVHVCLHGCLQAWSSHGSLRSSVTCSPSPSPSSRRPTARGSDRLLAIEMPSIGVSVAL